MHKFSHNKIRTVIQLVFLDELIYSSFLSQLNHTGFALSDLPTNTLLLTTQLKYSYFLAVVS